MRKSQKQGVCRLDRLSGVKKKKTRATKTHKNVYIHNHRHEVSTRALKITANQHIVTRLRLSAFIGETFSQVNVSLFDVKERPHS